MIYKNTFVGIDPGEDGALVVINDFYKNKTEIFLYDCPKTIQEMNDLICNLKEWGWYNKNHDASLRPIIFVAIEKATKKIKLPNKTLHATVLWGNYQTWLALLTAHNFKYEIVPARRWQSILDGNKKLSTKERAWETACRLYPEAVPLLKGKRGAKKYGRSDALCIAEWGRRNL